MRGISHEFYPMSIIHSRYSGTYSGGAYILIAGTHNPRQDTGAVGSDPDCMSFWSKVEEEGPVIEIGNEDNVQEIYADSGPNPAVLFQRYKEFCGKHIQNKISSIVTEVIRNYPEVEKQARENVVDLHKLNLIAEGKYRQNTTSVGVNAVSEELASRFLEYSEIPSTQNLDDSEKEEIKKFAQEIDEDFQVPLQYTWINS